MKTFVLFSAIAIVVFSILLSSVQLFGLINSYLLSNRVDNINREYLLSKTTEVIPIMHKLLVETNSDRVLFAFFHNEEGFYYFGDDSFFSHIWQVTKPDSVNTLSIRQNIPVSTLFFLEDIMTNKCYGWEHGTEIDSEVYQTLPPRLLYACIIFVDEVAIGAIAIVYDSTENISQQPNINLLRNSALLLSNSLSK